MLAHIEDIEQAGDIVDLLQYDENTAGGIMGTEMVIVNENWSMPECLREMRQQAEDMDDMDIAHDAVLAAEDGVDKVVADFLRSFAFGHFDRLNGKSDAALDGGKFVVPERLAFLDQLHQLALGAGGDGNDDVGVAWDGVSHIAALPFRQSGVTDEHSLAHKAAHEFIGIGAAFVDFQSAVSSAQSFEGHAPSLAVFEGFNLQILHGGGNVDAARAADIEFALRLAVEVEEHFPLQFALLQAEGAKHARFLVGSNKGFQRAVLEGFILHDGHDGSYAHAVVST